MVSDKQVEDFIKESGYDKYPGFKYSFSHIPKREQRGFDGTTYLDDGCLINMSYNRNGTTIMWSHFISNKPTV